MDSNETKQETKKLATPSAELPNEWFAFEGKSHVRSFRYNAKTQELDLNFGGDANYRYAKVPDYVVDQLRLADSKGGYFHSGIKNKFAHLKLNAEEAR